MARVDALKDRIRDRPKSLDILVSLGDLYYQGGRYADAIDWYGQAIAFAEPAWKKLDALPAAARAAKPSAKAAAACRRDGPERRGYEAIAAEAEAFARARARGDAAHCWKVALAPALDARARRGSALLLAGKAEEGLADEEAVLARDPRHGDALFFAGVAWAGTAHGDAAKLDRARDAWRRFAELYPDDPRAPRAREGAQRLEAMRAAAGADAGAERAPPQAATAGGKPSPSAVAESSSARPERSEAESKGETVAPLPAGGPAFWSAAERQAAEGEALLARGDAQGARQKLEPLVAPVMLEEREAPPRLAARVLAAMGYVNAALGRPERGGPMLRMALERDPSNEAARRAVAALDAKAPLPPFAAPAASASH
jgi:hypothetical protein